MKTSEEVLKDRDEAILKAREVLAREYFVLDTETTGLNNAQMCQMAILGKDGMQYKSLVKPTIPIEVGASNVHHITDEMVKDAPIAPEVMKNFPELPVMVIYNAPFDIKVMQQSLSPYKMIPVFNHQVVDAMQLFSKYRGEWDEYHGNYKWYKLGIACAVCGIKEDVELHDALSDCIMTERLMKFIASQWLSTEQEF